MADRIDTLFEVRERLVWAKDTMNSIDGSISAELNLPIQHVEDRIKEYMFMDGKRERGIRP